MSKSTKCSIIKQNHELTPFGYVDYDDIRKNIKNVVNQLNKLKYENERSQSAKQSGGSECKNLQKCIIEFLTS